MNHLIQGAVFWVTGERGGTDGRLELAGSWPPAAGRNQTDLISHTHTVRNVTFRAEAH